MVTLESPTLVTFLNKDIFVVLWQFKELSVSLRAAAANNVAWIVVGGVEITLICKLFESDAVSVKMNLVFNQNQ